MAVFQCFDVNMIPLYAMFFNPELVYISYKNHRISHCRHVSSLFSYVFLPLCIDKYAPWVVSLKRNMNIASRVIMEAGKNPALCLSNRDICGGTREVCCKASCSHWGAGFISVKDISRRSSLGRRSDGQGLSRETCTLKTKVF